ncbi:MAG TPA: energy transducer TonB [Gammaproteobacteria bacterium]|nr:energy transducer TonB [Gammaproteobacteria bacterium]
MPVVAAAETEKGVMFSTRCCKLLWVSFALLPGLSLAQAAAVPEAVGTYIKAKAIFTAAPSYPQADVINGREGWVMLSFVVSKEGRVNDVMIEDSSGNEDLERAAVRSVHNWRYEPATLNGKPMEQSMTSTRIIFQIDHSEKGASRGFVKKFKQIQAAISSGDLKKADEMLTSMQFSGRMNLYEDAWFWWSKYSYLHATGNAEPEELIDALRKATGYEVEYLPPAVFVAASEQLYALQVRALDFSGAMHTFERLSGSKSAPRADSYKKVLAAMKPLYDKIKELAEGSQVLKLNGQVGAHSYWVHKILRRSFSLGDVQGQLESLDIRCERGYKKYIKIAAGSVWNVPTSWGDCGVYVKGSKGAAFAFYAYPSK